MQDNGKDPQDRRIRKQAAAFIVSSCIIIVFYFCIKRSSSFIAAVDNAFTVFQPIIIGLVMAFLMNPVMDFLEDKFSRLLRKFVKSEEKIHKTARPVAAIISLLVLVGIVSFFIWAIMPELIETIKYLVNNIDKQIAGVLDWCNTITKGKYEKTLMNAKDSKLDVALDKGLALAQQYLNYDKDDLFNTVTTSVLSVTKVLINLIIGMFVAVYVLVSKETFKGQAKKVICGHFKAEHANIILELSRKSGDIFYGFIIGKIIDSILIGIICYICCLIMKMPYALLVSVIIGITNIIPVFGPYIGAVPTVIIIFLTEPMQGIYFLIFILILQQFDGNFLGPKILGNSTGLSSFWVVFAVVVGGGLFGIPGMVIGVPVMGIVYFLLGKHARFMLRKKNLPTKTTDYVNLEKIDVETNTLISYSQEEGQKKKHDRYHKKSATNKKK